jgi:enterochelin esterase-like enzyme
MRFGLTLALVALAAAPVAAQAPPLPAAHPPFTLERTEQLPLDVPVNNEHYLLSIALPPSYEKEKARRYPVVYLLDGYWDFPALYHMQGGLLFDKAVPEHILVGIGYQAKGDYDRMRAWDLSPVADRQLEKSGGAPAFLKLIETRIVPLVERDYRADPSYRVLAGSSFGGLMTLFAMVEWPEFVASIRRFDAQLRGQSLPKLRYAFHVVEGEAHAGSKPEAFNRGLRFALRPYMDRPGAGK